MHITESFLNSVYFYCAHFCSHSGSTKSPKKHISGIIQHALGCILGARVVELWDKL